MKEKLQQDCECGKEEDYNIIDDGLIRFKNIIHMSNNVDLKRIIMREFHENQYLDHQVDPRGLQKA